MSGNLLTQYPFTILNSTYGVNIYNSTDLLGNPRITDDTLDIGCYESSGTKRSLKLLSTYPDTTLCYGGKKTCVTKTAGTVQTYQWQQKQNNVISTISSMPSIALTELKTTKQYRIKVMNNECLPLSDSSNWFFINVNNPIKKGIVKNPNKDTITLSQTMQLSTQASGYSSLLWSTGASTPSISVTGSSLGPIGKYQFTLEAKNNNGCIETDTVYIHTKANTSLFPTLTQAKIKLYPLPVQDILTLEIENWQNTSLTITSLEGKIIFNQDLKNKETQISTSNLKTGLYLVTLKKDNENVSIKWVKE